MKISYNWLKAYIQTNKTAEELADILTNTGLEVEKVGYFESIKGGLDGFVVGEVLEKEKHPNADKLALTKVNIGEGEPLSIVCGAPNVAVGQKVIVATVGTVLYDDKGSFTIKKSKLRGEISEGMLCSEVELSLGSDHEGIMVLPKDTQVGELAKNLFEVEQDVIFDIGLTPNRSDAMSHIGVARDVAAALNVFEEEKTSYHFPEFTFPDKVESDKKITVEVQDVENCPRYSSVLIDHVEVKDSPIWLQNKLKAVGLKPVNNVVDITNFVLKEYGQALHAFDADEVIGNKVIVKKATENEVFITLDEKEIKLKANDLMICNEKESMCIAGVFGGVKSGVKAKTKTVFLESAYFNSASIRKTSTTHKLQTDAASRYEKGADPKITIEALKRAASMICELANGQIISDIQDFYPKEIEPFKVSFRYSRLNILTGVEIDKNTVKQILKDLEIDILSENDDKLELSVPQYRADVQREIDVVEEVLRIYGFNNIATPETVFSTLSFNKGIDKNMLKDRVSDNLNGLGFSEIMTNSISKSEFYSEDEQKKLVKLQNSMTAELDVMRQNMLFDGLEVLSYNINRKNSSLKMFEFGHTYNSDYTQNGKLVLFQTGFEKQKNWIQKGEKSNFYHIMSAVRAVFKQLKIKDLKIVELGNNQYEFAVNLIKNEKVIASVGKIDEAISANHDIKQDVFFAEINWDLVLKLSNRIKTKFEQITKFPEVNRDLALIIDEEIKFDDIKNVIFKSTKNFLTGIDLFDIFKDDEKVGRNKKSYAVSLKLRDKTKTLVDKDIDRIIAKVMRNLENELNANIRR